MNNLYRIRWQHVNNRIPSIQWRCTVESYNTGYSSNTLKQLPWFLYHRIFLRFKTTHASLRTCTCYQYFLHLYAHVDNITITIKNYDNIIYHYITDNLNKYQTTIIYESYHQTTVIMLPRYYSYRCFVVLFYWFKLFNLLYWVSIVFLSYTRFKWYYYCFSQTWLLL